MALTSSFSLPEEVAEVATDRLEQIAHDAVRLAALGPKLARLAQDLEAQARTQARQAATVAATMEQLTGALDTAVAQLRGSAGQVGNALATVSRIADQTKILSFNASIEAARAGVSGLAFSVVVEEVKRLADTSGQTAQLIETRVQEMHGSIGRVANVTGKDAVAGQLDACTVGAVEHEVQGMNRSAGQQLENARQLLGLGEGVNGLTERLLLGMGTFRFPAHARAEAALGELADKLADLSFERAPVERALAGWLGSQVAFELVYCTDGSGRQFVDNLGRRDGTVARDHSGYGRDWSARPWYRSAVAAAEVSSTDIYRSAATGEYCFTVVAPLLDDAGSLRGVLAADVNFRRLLGEA